MAVRNTIQVGITVPKTLKPRMDAAPSSINWSAVASAAFEAKLLELESQKEVKNMEDVIARLKAANEIEANEEYQEGHDAGTESAKEVATPKQLRRITEYIERCERDGCDWWDVDGHWNAPFGATDYFAFAALGITDLDAMRSDREAPDDFWRELLGDDAGRINDPDFFHGFGGGAAALWKQVENRL